MSASAPPPQLPRSTGKAGEELVEGLFALAHAPGSRLLLLGIANSIDLVQQLMRPGGSLHVSGCQGLVGGSGRLAVAGLLRLPWWRLALPSPALTPPPPARQRLNLRPAHELFPAYQRQQFSQVGAACAALPVADN